MSVLILTVVISKRKHNHSDVDRLQMLIELYSYVWVYDCEFINKIKA